MPTISQIISASYPAVLNEKRKPTNQWAESAFLQKLESMGALKRKSLGVTINETLDYRRNQGGAFLATDFQPMSLAKTDVLTEASYDPGQLLVPIVWSKGDEAKNPSENQKIALVKALLENAINSHDDLIEEALFSTTTNGFLGLGTILPASGEGSPGGIDAGVDAFWRHAVGTYASNGTDIHAKLTAAYNSAAKGSGGLAPNLIVSGPEAQAIYEATLTTNERYINAGDAANSGFKTVAFKQAQWIFSQYGDTDAVFGLHPKCFQVIVSKEAFRDLGDVQEIENGAGYRRQLYSMLQTVTGNKSRLFRLDQ